MRLIDEDDRMPDAACPLSMPSDPRLTIICQAILRNPSDRRTLDDWASLAAMGRRTLTRRFRQEMGISLAMWQRQVRIMEALSLLAAGSSIIQASLAVGYESPAAFTAMFTRALGAPPRRYLQWFPPKENRRDAAEPAADQPAGTAAPALTA